MFYGFGLIALSFCILVALVVWLLADKKWEFWAISIPFLIWYGLIVYIGSSSVLGYPTDSVMKDGTIIVSYRIVEPAPSIEGGMYFWGVPVEKITDKTSVPRSFSMPYDRELHKQLTRKKKGEGGFLMWRRGGKKKGGEKGNDMADSIGKFEVLNPSKILTKSK